MLECFVTQLEGQLTEEQCVRLMKHVDADASGTVDFNELTRALQKLDLRVELYNFLLVALRFFVAEMQRTHRILKIKFNQAASKHGQARQETTDGESTMEMSGEGVRALLKSLDASFPASVVHRMIGEMAGAQMSGRQRRMAGVKDKLGEDTRVVSADAFARVVMSHGFNSVTSSTFKEVGQAINSTVRVTQIRDRQVLLEKGLTCLF